jgi:Sulfotransferase family
MAVAWETSGAEPSVNFPAARRSSITTTIMNSVTSTRDRIGSLSEQALERLIYVVGSARGGTTLTKNVIGLHDDVISFNGPTHFLNHVWRHRNRVEDRLWRVIFWMPDSVRRDVVRESLSEERKAAYIQYINQVLNRKNLREMYQLYPLVRGVDPEEQRNPASIRAWLDKGNDFWGVDLLPAAFPQARFVFVVRDPRGAVASLAKRIADARPDTELKVETRDVVTSAIYWHNLAQKELRFARRYPAQTVFFRYEDLVTSPLTIIPRLYELLGLPAMAEKTLRSRLADIAYGASINFQEVGTGLDSRPIERWRKALTDEAADIVAEICADTAQRLGYDVAPQRHRGIRQIAGLMGSPRGQLTVAAKLAYLALRDFQLGKMAPSFSPFRLLNAT